MTAKGGRPKKRENIGLMMNELYAHFLSVYGDADLASAVTATEINKILQEKDRMARDHNPEVIASPPVYS